MEKAPFVYIMASKRNGTLYTGVTSDLVKRVWEHHEGRMDGFTKRHGVKRLVYYEPHGDMYTAITREKQIKKWRREWKVRLIEGMNPDWRDLWETIVGRDATPHPSFPPSPVIFALPRDFRTPPSFPRRRESITDLVRPSTSASVWPLLSGYNRSIIAATPQPGGVYMPRILLAVISSTIVVLGAVWLASTSGDQASADHGAPIPDVVDILAVDTNTTGNAPKTVATVQPCRETTVGSIFDVDIIVDEVPPYDPGTGSGGVNVFAVNVLFNPAVLRINSRNDPETTSMIMQDPDLGTPFYLGENTFPQTDGNYRFEFTELGGTGYESGVGVLVHLTIQIVGSGTSPLTLTDTLQVGTGPKVLDAAANAYTINNNNPGEIRSDGTTCPPDSDDDGVIDANDNCAANFNPGQRNWDFDQFGDVCDPDQDGDGVANGSDACPDSVLGQAVDEVGCSQVLVDGDLDGVCDPGKLSTLCVGSDNCPIDANSNQTNTDTVVNPPGDGLGDICDPDDDDDSWPDSSETGSAGTPPGNVLASNPLDPASTPELCDNSDNDLNEGFDEGYPNNDGDTYSGHPYADCVDPDDDNDFFPDSGDNCQFVFNITQTDFDVDGVGDACDDFDGDGVTDDVDNCRVAYNPGQTNTDVIVSPPGDPLGDVCDSEDDNDGILDPFDNCPAVPNPLQEDIDADGPGDACDDSDGDTVMDDTDNCYAVQNTDQAESDADGTGNACDPEDDGDGIFDGIDGTWNGSAFTSQSTVFSNAFTDEHLAGVSHGSILDRGAIYVQVSDLSAEGFLLWGIGAGAPGTVDVCNETQIIIGGGSIATASCTASTVIRVIAGSVSARAGNLIAGLPVGANVIIEDVGAGYSIENTSASAANISVNGSQLPPGTIDDDGDNDGYLTARENFLGTLPGVGCALTTTPRDENPDPNPRDYNDDRWIDLSDISMISPHYNSPSPVNSNYSARFDLNADGWVNLSDVSLMSNGYNTQCSPQ